MSAMSTRSSSGSWSEEAPPNIIDLDKYIRGSVRPSRRSHSEVRHMRSKQLVVDAGIVERKTPAMGPLDGAPQKMGRVPHAACTPVATSGKVSSNTDSGHQPHAKRYSHDSGLSDGSYHQRKRRTYRHSTAGDVVRPTGSKRTPSSNDSLRAFRTVCERALQDQQAQIAHVAHLCEKMTSRRVVPAPFDSSSQRSTDTSSSLFSDTKDKQRKDKHRTEECKTYKIIMNKLDELNGLFTARARAAGPAAPAAGRSRSSAGRVPLRRHASLSSGSVSVSDKFVSTEPALLQMAQCPQHKCGAEPGCELPDARRHLQAVPNTCSLDIVSAVAPSLHFSRNYVAQRYHAPHSSHTPAPSQRCAAHAYIELKQSHASSLLESDREQRCEPHHFDLDNPIHLYSQAKRLEALAATTQQAHQSRLQRLEGPERGAEAHVATTSYHEVPDTSLCSLCRGYWRSFRQYVVTQMFSSSGIKDDQ